MRSGLTSDLETRSSSSVILHAEDWDSIKVVLFLVNTEERRVSEAKDFVLHFIDLWNPETRLFWATTWSYNGDATRSEFKVWLKSKSFIVLNTSVIINLSFKSITKVLMLDRWCLHPKIFTYPRHSCLLYIHGYTHTLQTHTRRDPNTERPHTEPWGRHTPSPSSRCSSDSAPCCNLHYHCTIQGRQLRNITTTIY